nr:hypothetical protein [uncultured bacterium]
MGIEKKSWVMMALIVFAVAGIAAVDRYSQGRYKNLKILPQDITEKRMDSIMDSYTKALGVNCAFCHTEVKNFKDSIDYASDENVMKENARAMMRMTIEINKTHFYFDKNERPEYLKVISCKTCHRGEPFPAE